MQQGFFSVQQTCPTCHGTGQEITDPCGDCDGVGRIRKNKTLQVKIPAGIDDGMRIRSTGNGEPGLNGGPPGDLYVEIRIKPHGIFERQGEDLHCELTIPFTKAALGGVQEVPTLAGRGEITMPEGTQTGKTFRLRGKGIKGVRSSYPGDLYCHIVVETPVRLNDEQGGGGGGGGGGGFGGGREKKKGERRCLRQFEWPPRSRRGEQGRRPPWGWGWAGPGGGGEEGARRGEGGEGLGGAGGGAVGGGLGYGSWPPAFRGGRGQRGQRPPARGTGAGVPSPLKASPGPTK